MVLPPMRPRRLVSFRLETPTIRLKSTMGTAMNISPRRNNCPAKTVARRACRAASAMNVASAFGAPSATEALYVALEPRNDPGSFTPKALQVEPVQSQLISSPTTTPASRPIRIFQCSASLFRLAKGASVRSGVIGRGRPGSTTLSERRVGRIPGPSGTDPPGKRLWDHPRTRAGGPETLR